MFPTTITSQKVLNDLKLLAYLAFSAAILPRPDHLDRFGMTQILPDWIPARPFLVAVISTFLWAAFSVDIYPSTDIQEICWVFSTKVYRRIAAFMAFITWTALVIVETSKLFGRNINGLHPLIVHARNAGLVWSGPLAEFNLLLLVRAILLRACTKAGIDNANVKAYYPGVALMTAAPVTWVAWFMAPRTTEQILANIAIIVSLAFICQKARFRLRRYAKSFGSKTRAGALHSDVSNGSDDFFSKKNKKVSTKASLEKYLAENPL
ncbi:MAG: hypothetical protein Q9221_000741 [Calogaya cf. arnoldii]